MLASWVESYAKLWVLKDDNILEVLALSEGSDGREAWYLLDPYF